MAKHARLGPSSSYIWLACTASPRESDGKRDDGNDAARSGTATHGVVAECLVKGLEPADFLGREFLFCYHPESESRVEDFAEVLLESAHFQELNIQHTVTVSAEMVECCESYVKFVRDLVQVTGAEMLVEQRVPIGQITGEEGAVGTSDVILKYTVESRRVLHAIDLKSGWNRVSAYEVVRPALPDPITSEMLPPLLQPNTQLAMYAGGALHEHRLFNDFDEVRMTIVQPPLNNVSEYAMTVADLDAFLAWIKQRAEETRTNPQFLAGDHCTYCKARAGCTARDEYVLRASLEGFTDVGDPQQIAAARPARIDSMLLGVYYEKTTTIRKWCDDVDEAVKQALKSGSPVVGANGEHYKLVAGKRGNKQWDNPDEVEELLKKQMRLRNDQMYSMSLLTPTQAYEQLAHVPKPKKGAEPKKPVLGERQWNTLAQRITQKDGSPTVAPGSDPRPALPSALDGFADLSPQLVTEPDAVDLFN